MPREVGEAEELFRIFDVDGEDERVRFEVVEVGEGLYAAVASDVCVEFLEEADDLFGARAADAARLEEEVGADVCVVCELGIEHGELSDTCVRREKRRQSGVTSGAAAVRSGLLPGKTRFLRVLAAVALAFTTRIWLFSSACCPLAAQSRSWRSYFCSDTLGRSLAVAADSDTASCTGGGSTSSLAIVSVPSSELESGSEKSLEARSKSEARVRANLVLLLPQRFTAHSWPRTSHSYVSRSARHGSGCQALRPYARAARRRPL